MINKKVENQTLYTRCPTCNTAFKVSDKLLAMANGKVRCGACLAVFQATDYMLELSKIPQTSVANTTTKDQQQDQSQMAPKQRNLSTTMDVQQDLHIGEPEGKASIAAHDPTSEVSAKSSKDSPFPEEPIQKQQAQDILQSPVQESTDKTTEVVDKDELHMDSEVDFDQSEFDHSGLDSIDMDSAVQGTGEDPFVDEEVVSEDLDLQEFSDDAATDDQALLYEPVFSESSVDATQMPDLSMDDLSPTEPEAEPANIPPSETEEQIDSSVENHTEVPEQVDVEETEFGETGFDETVFDETVFGESGIADTDLLDSAEYSENFQGFDDRDLVDELAATGELADQLSEQMLETDSEPDPLDEFDNIVEKNDKSMKIKLAAASLLVLLIIAFTSIWTNRQAIAWSESWGGTMNAVCQFLPCDLKPRRDVSKIKLLQRQLSPDEELENVLDVKVLLINEASFAQPYPTIKIAFSNKNGEQVSVKSYTPADYLDKQSLNDLMPEGSEVHIHFKTEVTHPDALGFEFIFE